MLFLSLWCPWPGWVIFLVCFGGSMYLSALLPPSFRSPEEFAAKVRKAARLKG
jgi:hypothetical protein